MKNWQKSLVNSEAPIIDAIEVIQNASVQIALVVDKSMRLMGTVTDGDIRRAILKHIPLDNPVREIMFVHPTTVSPDVAKDGIIEIMQRNELRQIPVVDSAGRLVDLKILVEMIQAQRFDNWVVLMAGGLGNRLKPLTDECPKPLLKVGGKPVLETIVKNFSDQGFHRFFISVNYKSKMIEDYFGDGKRFGVEINYLREGEKLGTAGALSLLPDRPDSPFLVMNGDLLTKINFSHLLDFHEKGEAKATMCVRKYDFQVPFGVVKIEHGQLVSVEEKPVQSFFVNAGIYVLNPETTENIPPNTYFDMTTLFNRLREQQERTIVFPIHEYWLDIGALGDYERAQGEFNKHFAY